MRILLAEDEMIERKAMVKFLQENFQDMEVVGEAANGRMAVEMALEKQPDIMFVDIQMPGLNGLEAIEKIQAHNPAIRFILVSAYDSFAYAKEAMRFGIKDYILKPGRKEEIVKTLLRVAKEIKAEKEHHAREDALLKEQLLMKMMQQPIAQDAVRLQKQCFPAMKSAAFFVIKATSSITEVEQELSDLLACEIILLEQQHAWIMGAISDKLLEKSVLLRAAKQLQEAMPGLFIGISEPCISLQKMPDAYQEAYAACMQLEGTDGRHYGFYQAEQKAIPNQRLVEQITSHIEAGNATEAVLFFKKNNKVLSDGEREDLYIQVKQLLTKYDTPLPQGSFTTLKTEEAWQRFIHLCCVQMGEYLSSRQTIMRVKAYVQEHFRDSLTLEEVAGVVQLSPNYLSNLFKQEVGETFIDYVTHVRLEKAKELLKDNAYTLKEISFMIGYKDPNYFSRVFKKHCDLSPSQYQRQICK